MKRASLLALTASGLLLLTAATRADVVPVAQEATIIGASSATNVNELALSYVHAQYSAGPTLARKAYFQFDLTGLNADTNALATFTVVFRNSYKHRVQLWGLDQPYPDFSSDITWGTAQANDTTNNELLSSGTYTGSKIGTSMILPLSGTEPYSFTITRLGDYLFDDKIILVVTGLSDPANNSSGLRMRTNSATLAFTQYTGNLPPAFSAVPDQTIAMRQTTVPLVFTLSDDSTPADSLTIWATSSDETVVPSGYVSLGGSGNNRNLTVTAVNQPGSAVVTLHAVDGGGLEAVVSFQVTVTQDPVISSVPHTHIRAGTVTTALPFTVGSWDIPLASLGVSAISGNQALVPDANVVISGSGSNRTVTITPAPGQTGVVPISLTVADSINPVSTSSFALMVLPADPEMVFMDHFDYPDGELIPLSSEFWTRRNSGTTKLLTSSQEVQIRSSGGSQESALAPLAGGPYPSGTRKVFYSSVKATWTAMPGNSTGPFVHLGDRVAGDSQYFVRVHTVVNDVPENFFRLGVAAGPGSTYVNLARDLTTNVTYHIVTRYDMEAGEGSLWVDPASEGDPSVTARDIPGDQVGSVGLRQASGMGTILLNDLSVRMITGPSITAISPPSAGNLDLEFDAGTNDAATDFRVVGAADLSAAFTDITAGITALGDGHFRARIPVSGDQGFYRVQRQPLTFN